MPELKMPDINYVMVAGNLTKDPVVRATTNGTPVANFTIAGNRRFRDNLGQWREDVCYIGVVAWYQLAESCRDNLGRGSAVIVEGELQSKSWKTDNGFYRNVIEIKARRIQYLHRRETFDDALPPGDAPAAADPSNGQDDRIETPRRETPAPQPAPEGTLRESPAPQPESEGTLRETPAPQPAPEGTLPEQPAAAAPPPASGPPALPEDPLKPRTAPNPEPPKSPEGPTMFDFGYEDLRQ